MATTESHSSTSSNLISDHHVPDGRSQRQWRSALTRAPVTFGLAAFLAALIAVLQAGVSLSKSLTQDTAGITVRFGRRQTSLSTITISPATYTHTATTWTRSAATYSYGTPPTTSIRPATVFTEFASTSTYDGSTETNGQLVITSNGIPVTKHFDVYVEDGLTVTSYVTYAETRTSAAYLDTATPTSSQSGTGAPVSQSYLLESSQSTTSVTSAVYHQPVPTTSSGPMSDSVVRSSEQATSSRYSVDYTAQSTSSSHSSRQSPFVTSQPSAPTSAVSTAGPAPSTTGIQPHSAFNFPDLSRVVKGSYTTERYYIATYLPSIIIILIKAVWSSIFSSIKLVEPFYRLSSPAGASASTSLLAEYLSSAVSFSFLSGLRSPSVLIASVIAVLTTILAPIAASSMAIHGTATCTKDGFTRSCAPVWMLNMVFVRLVQGLLAAICGLLVLYTMLTWRRRHSGLSSDPSSIVLVGELTSNPELVSEIRSIPSSAARKDIRRLLSGSRYALGTFDTFPYSQAFGIVKTNMHHNPVSGPTQRPFPTMKLKSGRSEYWRSFLRHDLPLLLLIATVLSLVLAYYIDGNDDPLNNFFSNNTFVPRLVLSALATIVDNRFKRLEREVRVLTPWRIVLSSRYGSKQDKKKADALQNGIPGTCYTSLLVSLKHRHWFVFLVSAVAMLGDILIVAIVGVPYSDAEIYEAFQVSTWLCVAILGMMILVVVASILVWRRTIPDAVAGDRIPDTIFDVARVLLSHEVGGQVRERIGLLKGNQVVGNRE